MFFTISVKKKKKAYSSHSPCIKKSGFFALLFLRESILVGECFSCYYSFFTLSPASETAAERFGSSLPPFLAEHAAPPPCRRQNPRHGGYPWWMPEEGVSGHCLTSCWPAAVQKLLWHLHSKLGHSKRHQQL